MNRIARYAASIVWTCAASLACSLPSPGAVAAVLGSGPDDGWTRGEPAAHGVDAASLTALDAAIRADEYGTITSLLVARDGAIVHETYFAGDAQTLRNTRSVTKTITGMLLGIAIEEGALPPGEGHGGGVTTPVLAALGDPAVAHADPRKGQITVEDLLTMSSLLECNDWNPYSRGNEERMYIIEDWQQFVLDLPIKGFAPWEPTPDESPFGRSFSYCTGGVFLLGRVLAAVTDQPVDAWAHSRLFAPLGIARVDWQRSPFGHEQTGGGLGLRTRDLAKFAQLYLQGGRWPGGQQEPEQPPPEQRQVVPRDWVRRSTTPHVRIDERNRYGYLWWLTELEGAGGRHEVWYMSGSGGNKVFAVPSLRLVAVITTENFDRRDAHALADRLFAEGVLGAVREAS